MISSTATELHGCGYGHKVKVFYVWDSKYKSAVNRYMGIDYAEDVCKHLNEHPNELMDFRETREQYRRDFNVKDTKAEA